MSVSYIVSLPFNAISLLNLHFNICIYVRTYKLTYHNTTQEQFCVVAFVGHFC